MVLVMQKFFTGAAIASFLFLCGSAWAVTSKSNTLGIVTGPKTGTYYAFGKDIADVGAKIGVNVEVKPSEGSIDNIKRINSPENAAIGIAQSDVLGFLARSKNPDSMKMANRLRMIYPFYNEEVHILARKDIKSFAELAGKKIAIGEEGSGNMLTAINLFSMMNITPAETRKISPAEGVVSVLRGDLDAAIFVAGKPVRLFKNLEDLTLPENQKYAPMLQNVHFLPLNSAKMLEEYKTAELTKADYNFIDQPVPTIAVQAVLVSYDFAGSGSKGRCAMLAKLANGVRNHMENLKKNGHPKWQEVDLDAQAGFWKKDHCVWPEAAVKDSHALEHDLIKIIEGTTD